MARKRKTPSRRPSGGPAPAGPSRPQPAPAGPSRPQPAPAGPSRPQPAAVFTGQVTNFPVADLKSHPRNYQSHPEDQLVHLVESLLTHGYYRNIVVARDQTILAGHGIVLAAKSLGYETIPGYRLDLDPDDPRALKVLVGDNEQGHLAERNDRELTDLLKDILAGDDHKLLGTGYDEAMLANLIMVTRTEAEIHHQDENELFAGMPDYEPGSGTIKLIVNFRTQEDRAEFLRLSKLDLKPNARSTWWPVRDKDDSASVGFEG